MCKLVSDWNMQQMSSQSQSRCSSSDSVSGGHWPASCAFPATMEIAQWAHSPGTVGVK